MGFIKSALELAMEKTEGLQVDKAQLRRDELYRQGRGIGARMVQDGVQGLAQALKGTPCQDKTESQSLKQGVLDSLLANMTFTAQMDSATALPTGLKEAMEALGVKGAEPLVQTLEQLRDQFLEDLQQLKEALAQQLGPRLKQRAEQMAAQAGVQYRFVLEKDPDYIKVLNQNLERARAHYQPALEELKQQIQDRL